MHRERVLMGRISVNMTSTAQRRQPSRAAKLRVKPEPESEPKDEPGIKRELPSPELPSEGGMPRKRGVSPVDLDLPEKMKKKRKSEDPQVLQARKIKSYTQHNHQSPFPTFAHPTPAECKLAHRILAQLHGPRERPTSVVASSTVAGCGASPCVLDALVRTILSQNTSSANSSRAFRSLAATYGHDAAPARWAAVVAGGQPRLEETIRSGGLARVKSRVILSLLEQVHARYGIYSLDHLHRAGSADEAMRELLSFRGVGPKTASCVLLFSLGRASFAVDTHVWRITDLLGWRPADATRDETHLHLDARIPDEDKYGLHVLMVTHGRNCAECKAGGRAYGRCELRKAFCTAHDDD